MSCIIKPKLTCSPFLCRISLLLFHSCNIICANVYFEGWLNLTLFLGPTMGLFLSGILLKIPTGLKGNLVSLLSSRSSSFVTVIILFVFICNIILNSRNCHISIRSTFYWSVVAWLAGNRRIPLTSVFLYALFLLL